MSPYAIDSITVTTPDTQNPRHHAHESRKASFELKCGIRPHWTMLGVPTALKTESNLVENRFSVILSVVTSRVTRYAASAAEDEQTGLKHPGPPSTSAATTSP